MKKIFDHFAIYRRFLSNPVQLVCILLLGSLLLSLSKFALAASIDSVKIKAHGSTEYPPYPEVNYQSGTASVETIKKGEYLAKAGDCIACHTDTKNGGAPFAGGLPFATPFGIFYSPNITPDKETGIGDWTDEDFVNAMRHGVNEKGENLFPVFPYIYFNKISDEDALAIKAFLFSTPAVSKQNLEPDVPWPLNVRFLQYGWKLLFFYPYTGEFEPDSSKDEQWNRGKYIVDGLGHCSMCHTPLNFLGGPKRDLYLTGAMVDGYYAPNINSYGLKDASDSEVVRVFTKEELLFNRGKVQGPMAEVDHNSLQHLSNYDLNAMAVYLKSLPPVEQKQDIATGKNAGRKIYNSYCAACHTTGASGAPKLGNKEDWDPLIKQGIETLEHNAIVGINSMPPKGTCVSCSDAQIKQVVEYMVSVAQDSKGGNSGPIKRPRQQAPLPKGSGERVYNNSCAACHATGKLGAPKVGDKEVWAPLIDKGMEVLFYNSIHGYHEKDSQWGMPAKGACVECTDAEIQAAVVYMVQQSKTSGDYSLWND